jgi:hypothetical protein
LAISLLLTAQVVLGVLNSGWILKEWTLAVSALAVLTVPGAIYFFAALAQAKSRECTRCHGTGVDFKDRVWTGRRYE